MSIEDKAQAEAKRLMAEVNQLQTKAKNQNIAKKAEAQKLIAEINRLQVAAIKEQDTEKARQAKLETKRLFEEQLQHIRSKQKNTREQLNRLMQAKQKYDLVQQSGKPTDAKLQQQLLQLIKKKKEEFVRLNQEAESIRQQAQQKSIILGGSAEASTSAAKRQAENTNLTDRAKAEAEKLINEVSRPKRDAADKAEEVGKMIAEINRLQMAAEQGNLSDNEAEQLEDRINRIESKQREARDQINQLTQAKIKYELALARSSKEKNEEKMRRAQDEKLQKELSTLIQKKESEQTQLMEELEVIRMRAEQEAALLKAQRDAARALAEQQAQTEAESGKKTGGIKTNTLLFIAIIVVVLLAIGVGVFLALPLLQKTDNAGILTPTKPSQTSQATTGKAPTQTTRSTPKPVATSKVKSLGEFSDPLQGGGFGPAMVKLPAGSFIMGSPDHLPYSDERPHFKASLKQFSISKYEITFADYQKFARSTGQRIPNDNGWGRKDRPVINVSWEDADAYTRWLTLQTDNIYRLPTEREWEYAARAGTTTLFWWGKRLSKKPPKANCGVCGSQWDGTQTAPVGAFPANAFGLHDVIGNVMEWTSSCHHLNYADAPEIDNGWEWDDNKADCGRRMIRSSAFNTYKRDIRITRRQAFIPKSRSNNLGFRVVRVD